jgi:hypothetical protein
MMVNMQNETVESISIKKELGKNFGQRNSKIRASHDQGSSYNVN